MTGAAFPAFSLIKATSATNRGEILLFERMFMLNGPFACDGELGPLVNVGDKGETFIDGVSCVGLSYKEAGIQ